MSISTPINKVKAGVTQLGSFSGLKSAGMQFGLGAAIGAIVSLVLHALQIFVINKYMAAYAKVDGYSIYPNQTTKALFVEDIILILISISMFFTKRLWLSVGFIVGWYASNYMGLYTALKLPTELPTVP